MTDRLPSRSALACMTVGNRMEIIEHHAHRAEAEHAGILMGMIRLTDGLTRERALDNVRRRLKRAEAVAEEFDVTI